MGFVRLLQRELRECSVDVRRMDYYDRRNHLVCQEKSDPARKGPDGQYDRLGLTRFSRGMRNWTGEYRAGCPVRITPESSLTAHSHHMPAVRVCLRQADGCRLSQYRCRPPALRCLFHRGNRAALGGQEHVIRILKLVMDMKVLLAARIGIADV